MKSTGFPIVAHMLLVALRANRNSWSGALSEISSFLIGDQRSISIIFLSLEQYSYTPNMEYSRTFSAVPGNFGKKRQKFLPNPIDLLVQAIKTYSSEDQNQYEDALEKFDIPSVCNILRSTSKWNSIVKNVMYLEDMNGNSAMPIKTTFKEISHYSKMTQSICDKIEQITNELIKLEVANGDTKESNQKHSEFDRNISRKFSMLNQAKDFSQFDIRINVNKVEEECRNLFDDKMKQIFSDTEKFLKKTNTCQGEMLTYSIQTFVNWLELQKKWKHWWVKGVLSSRKSMRKFLIESKNDEIQLRQIDLLKILVRL